MISSSIILRKFVGFILGASYLCNYCLSNLYLSIGLEELVELNWKGWEFTSICFLSQVLSGWSSSKPRSTSFASN